MSNNWKEVVAREARPQECEDYIGTKGGASVCIVQNLRLVPSPKKGSDDHLNHVHLSFPSTKFDPVNPPLHWSDKKTKKVAEAAFTAWPGMLILRQYLPHIPASAT